MQGRRAQLRERIANPPARDVDPSVTPMQLRIDGGEEPYVHTVGNAPLGPVQKAVLHEARHLCGGVISPSRAGRVAHMYRNQKRREHGSLAGCASPFSLAAQGCCKYAATDGVDVLLGLMARGLVEHISAGVYVLREELPRAMNARVLPVWCSQFASCGWRGRRRVGQLGKQPKKCPRCGQDVVA